MAFPPEASTGGSCQASPRPGSLGDGTHHQAGAGRSSDGCREEQGRLQGGAPGGAGTATGRSGDGLGKIGGGLRVTPRKS